MQQTETSAAKKQNHTVKTKTKLPPTQTKIINKI
jgi:hypothetical protein